MNTISDLKISLPNNLKKSFNVDLIRVVSILMVLVLHTLLNFTERTDFFSTKLWFIFEPVVILSKTSVLLFFMLSGYLVINKERNIKENAQKTTKRIIIPLIFFSILNIFFELRKVSSVNLHLLDFLQSQLVRITNFPSSSLWFLVVLTFLYLLNPLWALIFSNKRTSELSSYLLILTFLFSLIGTFLKFPSLKNEVFFNNFTGWIGYIFFYLYGGAIKNNWISFQKSRVNIAFIVVGFIFTFFGDFYTVFTKVHYLKFVWSGYFFEYLSLPVALMSLGLFNILISYDFSKFKNSKKGMIIKKIIIWLAGLTFGIYLVHSFILSLMYIFGFTFDHFSMNVYLYNFLNYFIVFSSSVLIVLCIKRIPLLKKIIGE